MASEKKCSEIDASDDHCTYWFTPPGVVLNALDQQLIADGQLFFGGSPPVSQHQYDEHVSLHRFIKHKIKASEDALVINRRSKLQRELRAEQLAVSSSLKAQATAARTSL